MTATCKSSARGQNHCETPGFEVDLIQNQFPWSLDAMTDAPLHDIVNALIAVRAHAEMFAECFPECQPAVRRFTRGMQLAQRELFLKVRPELGEPLDPSA